MSETIDRDRREAIIRRIAGLMAKTTTAGCTEEEAMAAANLASKLMADYDLSLSDIKLKEQANLKQDGYGTNSRSADQPAFRCMMAIADLTDTRCWRDNQWKRPVVATFFGFETDVIVAKYIYAIVDRAITYSVIRWKYAQPEWDCLPSADKSLNQRSFEYGMTDRINDRLRHMKAERRKEAASTGRDLVVVKGAIVDEEYAKLSKRLGLTAGKRSKGVSVDRDAYDAGQDAGARVAFNSGIHQNADAAKIR